MKGKCKEKTEVFSRVVGFYRPVQQWNLGKQEEFKQRKVFKALEEKEDVFNDESQTEQARDANDTSL